jgi:hypothetical protein
MIIAAGCILVYPAQAAPPISATSAESSHLNASQRDTFTANNTGILCRVFEAKTA